MVRKKGFVPHNFKQIISFINKAFLLTFHVYLQSSGAINVANFWFLKDKSPIINLAFL